MFAWFEPAWIQTQPGQSFTVQPGRIAIITVLSPTSTGATATSVTAPDYYSPSGNVVVLRSGERYPRFVEPLPPVPSRCPLDARLYAERRAIPPPHRIRIISARFAKRDTRPRRRWPKTRLAICLPRRLI